MIIDVTIKFHREVSQVAQLAFFNDDRFRIHINSIMKNEDCFFVWTLTVYSENDDDKVSILDKLSNFAGIKAFSIEAREIQNTPLEDLKEFFGVMLPG